MFSAPAVKNLDTRLAEVLEKLGKYGGVDLFRTNISFILILGYQHHWK